MKRLLMLVVPMLAFAGFSPAPAAIDPTAPVRLSGLVPAWATPQARLGAVASSETIPVEIVLPWRNPASVKALVTAVSDPRSPAFRRFLTSAQFRKRFAPEAATVTAVTSWLRSRGLEVGQIPANKVVIPARGSARTVERAFDVSLARYRVGVFALRAPDRAPALPAALVRMGALVRGLDESSTLLTTGGPLTPDMLEHAVSADSPPPPVPETPASAADVTPPKAIQYAAPCSDYDSQKFDRKLPSIAGGKQPAVACALPLATLRAAYGADVMHRAKIDGTGATIVMIGSHAIRSLPGDLAAWSKRYGVPALRDGQFRQFSYPGAYETPNDPTGSVLRPAVWAQQAAMLFESMRVVAPGADYLYVGSDSSLDLQNALLLAVDQHYGDVIVNGWYAASEAQVLASDTAPIDRAAEMAAATGISVLFASGDLGDNAKFNATSTGSTPATHDIIVTPPHPSVSFPAHNPMVTAVGATSLLAGRGGRYLGELGWAKTARPQTADGKGWANANDAFYRASGGGRSLIYDRPEYQSGIVPDDLSIRGDGTLGRAVPDVAVNGDAETGMSIGYTMHFPDGANRYAERRLNADTAATGLFGGLVALAVQQAHQGLGFINPMLYAAAGSGGYRAGAYRDIVPGRGTKAGIRTEYVNGANADGGLKRTLKTFEQFGTNVPRSGYDTCTGIGTPGPTFFQRALANVPKPTP